MVLKEKDFVEIDYTGRLKEDNEVFDTTDKKLAKAENLTENPEKLAPVVICLGEGQLIKGIDKHLIGKEVGKYDFEVAAEDGFGKKDAKLIQLIPTAKFKKQNVKPEPGLSVEVDGMIGRIRAVTGGRTIVDFNHPLSGRDLLYHVEVKRQITDLKEKAESLIRFYLNLGLDVVVKEGAVVLKSKTEIPNEIIEYIKPKLVELAGAKDVTFELEKIKNPATNNDSDKGVEKQ
jgi:FKBP-type peptidyl-prolyl cis-trans isomerase 2